MQLLTRVTALAGLILLPASAFQTCSTFCSPNTVVIECDFCSGGGISNCSNGLKSSASAPGTYWSGAVECVDDDSDRRNCNVGTGDCSSDPILARATMHCGNSGPTMVCSFYFCCQTTI